MSAPTTLAGPAAPLAGTGRRVLFMCPDLAEPTGGLQVIYRHADLLNAAGLDAVVVHQQAGFRCRWFENSTPVTHLGALTVDVTADVLVVPEILAGQVVGNLPGLPTIVYNQNAYYTFNGMPVDPLPPATPYAHPDVRGVVVVSEDSEAYVRYAFPHQRVHRVRVSVDPELFHADRDREWRLAYMPRKNPHDSRQVLHLLNARGALEGVEVVALDGLPRAQVAERLRQTLVFLSFGHPEGFGLPAAEAMASGCVTVGYHGMGGAEFLRAPYAHPVAQGDVVGYARRVEALLDELRADPHSLLERAEAGAAFVADEYSPARERDSVVECWRAVVDDL